MSSQNSMKGSRKPLKGSTITSNFGSFETLNVANLQIESISVAGLFEDGIFQNVIIKDSEIINTVIGVESPNIGYFTNLKAYQDVDFISNNFGSNVSWSSDTSIFQLQNATLDVRGCSFLGNIEICENYIRATNPDGSINMFPNGTGALNLYGPIYNNISQGNFYSTIQKGSLTFIVNEDINLSSSIGSSTISTFDDQLLSTINGNIELRTETTRNSYNVSFITNSTDGLLQITTNLNHNLKSGDVITLSSTGSIDNNYTVGSIVSNNSFLLSSNQGISPNGISSNITTGSLIKKLNNNILLNTLSFVQIPTDTKLSFGNTNNSISGNTTNLLISSYGDTVFSTPTSNSLIIPKTTPISFAIQDTSGAFVTTGNYINYDNNGINIIGSDKINLSSALTQINSTNTRFYDPILTLGDYSLSSNESKDRGIEYRYYSSTGSMKLGWFGYKAASNRFTFIPDATNTNELISGIPGEFEIGDISANNITLSGGGNFNLNCGSLLNTSTITGCSGFLNLISSNTLNITSGNINVSSNTRISLLAKNDIYIPKNVPITISSSGSTIVEVTSGNLKLTSFRNLEILVQTKGSLILPSESYISFDGSSIGSQRILSNTSGDLIMTSNKNIYITTTSGNLVLSNNNNNTGSSASLQLGEQSQIIYGNTSGINIISNNVGSTLTLVAYNNTNLTSSFGNLNLSSYSGDINLYTTQGNVRVSPQKYLVFGISGTSNSIRTDSTGNLILNGSSSNSINLKNISDINLDAKSNVNISSGTFLNLSSDKARYLIADTTSNLSIVNNVGNLDLNSKNTSISNNLGGTLGTLNIINGENYISTNVFTVSGTVSGTVGSVSKIYTDNLKIKDPIITLADNAPLLNDSLDRGIEYKYTSKLGWFGWKNTTGRFTYYSEATNANEIVTGILGNAEFDSLYLKNNLTFSNAAQIDLQCGNIVNLNTIKGCSGIVNITGTNNVNVSGNNIMLTAGTKVQLPYDVPLSFGSTSNSISTNSNGTMTLTALDGAGTIVLNSNVQINGTTTNVYSTITNIKDPIISLGGVIGNVIDDQKDRGIEFKWNLNGQKTGFFGWKYNQSRFVFIKDGINTDEVFSGAYGDAQFGNGYFTNLDLTNGTISNVKTISGTDLSILSNSINLSSGNINLPFNSNLNFGNTTNSIYVNTFGNMFISTTKDLSLTSQTGNIALVVNTSGNSNISIPRNVPLYFGSTSGGTFISNNTSNNLVVSNSSGNIDFYPQNSTGSINIPNNVLLNFGSTQNSLLSDGTQLMINGYNGVNINTSNFNISGNVNIIGTITAATNSDFDINKYILPLGTSQIVDIQSINNYNLTSQGNLKITTVQPHNFSIGDSVKIMNSTSIPTIDDTYLVTFAPSNNEFIISGLNLNTAGGVGGTVKSNLTTYQGKDVGIQVNYWSTTASPSITSGSLGYKTGFFGFKNSTERWTFYKNATISNNIVTGSLSDIEVNKVFTSRLSGFVLEGGVSTGSNSVAGSNFQISGGAINGTPIGTNTSQTGRFTQLSNTVSASLQNVTFNSSIAYTFERYTLSSGGLQTRNPSTSYVVSMFSVSGPSYTSSSGTMPSSSAGIQDGTFKILVCNSMGLNSSHTIVFGTNKLITPNPINSNAKATKITFKRQGQSAQIIFDSQGDSGQGAWILLSNGVYVS
jgi:hypothetical protein